MGFFSSSSQSRSKIEGPWGLSSKTLSDWLGAGNKSASGITVTAETAQRYEAVSSCVNILAQSLAQISLHLYKRERTGTSKKKIADDHPLHYLLHDQPNKINTSYIMRSMLQMDLGYYGNAYAYIEYDLAGRVKAIWPWQSNKVRVEADGWNITYYFIGKNGKETKLTPSIIVAGEERQQVLHLRGASLNGITGLSPIGAARETIGTGVAAEKYGAKFFENGCAPQFVLTTDKTFGDPEKARKNIRKGFTEAYTGTNKAHQIPILEEGMTPHALGINPEDAQFLETKKFTRQQIAAIYRIPAHMINELDRATFSNIEHMSQEFVTFTLSPWFANWEQEFNRALLSPSERRDYYCAFLPDSLLRGDSKARGESYAKGINWGWLSPNEVRDLENMNPRENGDVYLQPVNMLPSGKDVNPNADGDSETK